MHQLTAQKLAAVHAVSDHDVSPRDGTIVLTWNATGVPSLYRLRDSGPEPLVEGRAQYAHWSPDGEWLVFLRDEGGREAEDVVLLDAASGTLHPLTSDAHSYMWPRFAPDGRLAVICNRDGTFDPFLLDRGDGTLTRLDAGAQAARALAWSPDGAWLAFARLRAADEEGNIRFGVYLWESDGGQSRELATLGGDFFEVEFAWRPATRGEPPRLTLAADHGEFQDLLELSPDGSHRWLSGGEGDKAEPSWSPDGRFLAYVWERRGNLHLYLLDSEDGSTREISVGEGVHRQPRWAPDGQSLTVRFENATQPPDLWRVPLEGNPYPLTHGLPDDFPVEVLTPSEVAAFPSVDGRLIHGLLYTPREANGAAVVWVHGGPTASHRNHWFPDIQLLTSLGFAVLAPNVRGSTGYGRSFRDLARMDWGGGDLADLGAAHDFLQGRHFHRIGIMGGSYGGYLTLMALAKQPGRWDAGAALYPIANLETLFASSRPGDLRPYLIDQIGRPDERPAFYRERSPVNFVEQVEAPLLLLQGANDIRTPLGEAQGMADRLAVAGKLHDLHVYPNEGHGFQLRENREDALNRVVAFFTTHLVHQ